MLPHNRQNPGKPFFKKYPYRYGNGLKHTCTTRTSMCCAGTRYMMLKLTETFFCLTILLWRSSCARKM